MMKPGMKTSAAVLSALSVLAAQEAMAQTAAPADAAAVATEPAEAETVSVTASRITITGYQQPTPVTVVGTEQLQREAKVDVADMIRDLPSFGVSASPNNSTNQGLFTAGIQGLNLVSLRNLNFNRNLVLFDGQRVVTSSIQGGVDMSTIPSSLVDRVEVVTGGASAAWGSDAITGVVNIVLNKKFTGVAVNLEDSDTFHNNHNQRKAELSFGTNFAGDRGHLILSAAYVESPDEFWSYDVEGFKYQRLVSNPVPGANPKLIHADYVGLARATPGGIITGCGPAGSVCPLQGIYFTGPNGTPSRFDYGNVSSNYYTNGGTRNTTEGDRGLIGAPSNGTTLFGYGSFKITDSITASLQVNHGEFKTTTNSWSDVLYGALTINQDNAFLPDSVRQQMISLGIPSFSLGTMLHTPIHRSLQDEIDDIGGSVSVNRRTLDRGVVTLDGKLGDKWSWNVYYQEGRSQTDIVGLNNQQNSLLRLGVDAVQVTSANVGSSGLPVGAIVCRTALTNPATPCQPVNVFGENNWSLAARDYVTGTSRFGGQSMLGILRQQTASASMQGELPFGLPAGPLLTAFGVEYRQETGRQYASPAAQASTFQLGNFKNFFGQYHTREAFAQVSVPVLKDQGVQSLAFDLAGRYTNYTTSGAVETYKLGLTSQVVDDFRLRASYSRDIRAPSLFDLFNTGTPVTGTAIDPRSGAGVTIFSTNRGNPNLDPEKSTTTSVGFVLTPRFLNGFNLSLDYYDINIKGAISQYNSATILRQCAQGNQTFCDLLEFNGQGGALSQIFIVPVNADSLKTTGLDFAMDYRTFVGPGAMNVSVLSNYTIKQEINTLGQVFDYAGSVGGDSAFQGVPKLNGHVAVTYVQGPLSGTVQGRYIGPAHINNQWVNGIDVDNNDIAAQYYLDLRGSYKFTDAIQGYAALDNVLDRKSPPVPFSANSASAAESPFQDAIYDAYGRVWRVGIRAKF